MNLPYGYDVYGKKNNDNIKPEEPNCVTDNTWKYKGFGRGRETDLEFIALKHKVKEDTLNHLDTKKYKVFKLSNLDLGPIMMVLVCMIAVAIFIGIDKYLEQKHIDSGTPYIRFMKPEGYLIETLKLKDGTTWDVLCIDGVKTIYDIDKRLVSETNLACF